MGKKSPKYRGGPKDQKGRGWERVQKASSASRKPPTVRKQPRTASLPGLENHAIRALDLIAADYADIRDSRMDLLRQEVDLKARTLKLMKKHGKTKYKHNGIEITLAPGEETIKVKVRKPGEDEGGEDIDAEDDVDTPVTAPDDVETDTVEDETLSNA